MLRKKRVSPEETDPQPLNGEKDAIILVGKIAPTHRQIWPETVVIEEQEKSKWEAPKEFGGLLEYLSAPRSAEQVNAFVSANRLNRKKAQQILDKEYVLTVSGQTPTDRLASLLNYRLNLDEPMMWDDDPRNGAWIKSSINDQAIPVSQVTATIGQWSDYDKDLPEQILDVATELSLEPEEAANIFLYDLGLLLEHGSAHLYPVDELSWRSITQAIPIVKVAPQVTPEAEPVPETEVKIPPPPPDIKWRRTTTPVQITVEEDTRIVDIEAPQTKKVDEELVWHLEELIVQAEILLGSLKATLKEVQRR